MNDLQRQPLTVVGQLAMRLSPLGQCEQLYVTAEFQPFSSAFKPDLLFRPSKGPRLGQLIFMEFTQHFRGLQGRPVIALIEERREFVNSYIQTSVDYYVLFTDARVDNYSAVALFKKHVYVCVYSEDVDELVASLESILMI